jgi:hypothetical protein
MMSDILAAGYQTLAEAQAKISSCEKCNPKADIEFGLIMNFVTNADPNDTLFCQTESVECPNCGQEIWESTLVSFFPPGCSLEF